MMGPPRRLSFSPTALTSDGVDNGEKMTEDMQETDHGTPVEAVASRIKTMITDCLVTGPWNLGVDCAILARMVQDDRRCLGGRLVATDGKDR